MLLERKGAVPLWGRQLVSTESRSSVLRAKVEEQWWGVLQRAGRSGALGSQGKRYQVLYSGCALESPGAKLSNRAIWAPARASPVTCTAQCKTRVWGPFKEQEKKYHESY